MAKHVVIIGAGQVCGALVSLLPDEWTLTLVDINPEALASLPDEAGGAPVRKIEGDATSRLVLQKVGFGSLMSVAVLTGSDAANIEISNLILQMSTVSQLVCLLHDRSAWDASKHRRVDIIERRHALATLTYNRLGWTESRGVELGLGQGELLEATILDGSPAAGRPLKHLHPQQWLVAAVYREGRLIVPHGETILETGDRVLLVGEPNVLHSVRSFVRGGKPVFPLQFGTRIGYGPGAQVAEEARWLADVTLAEDLVPLDGDLLEMRDDEYGVEVAKVLHEHDIGCLVVGRRRIAWASRLGLKASRRKRLIAEADVPVLVARGKTPPVRQVLLAVGNEEEIRTMAHVSIDLARLCQAELTVLTVLPPALSHGDEQLTPMREVPGKVAHVASLYDVRVHVRHAEGNPIRVIREQAKAFDLLVMGNNPDGRNTVLTPDVALFLLHDAPCSTLFVPWDATYR